MSTWMVVEDEPDIYAVLLAMFEVWGIEGAAFVDGTEALAWVDDVDSGRIKSDLPELAIIDIRLPGAPGQEVAARLRQSPILKHMTIVLITAYRLPPSKEDEVMARAEADLLLYKPLPRTEEFRAILEQILAQRAELAVQEALQPEPEADTDAAGAVDRPVAIDAVDTAEPEDTTESADAGHAPGSLLEDDAGEALEDTVETEAFFHQDDDLLADDSTQPTQPVNPTVNRFQPKPDGPAQD